MAKKEKNYLTHPILGDGITNKDQATRVMAMKRTGGWTWIDPPKAKDNGNSTRTQGETGTTEEQTLDTFGS